MADLLQRGDLAVVRSIWRGGVWAAHPLRVLEHTADFVALWMRPGTVWKRPVLLDGTYARIPSNDPWQLQDEVWRPGGAIRLTEFGSAHSVVGFFEKEREEIATWYVNLEAPLTRTRFGFDTMDHMLDLWVTTDFASHRWKDEDELLEAVERGVIDVDAAAAIRAEGERAVDLLSTGRHIANSDWKRWHRDASWPLPELPADWAHVE